MEKESHPRTLIKTITFRACASVTTVLIVFAFTGKWLLSIGVGIVETVTKLILYYVHERIWDKVHWGRAKHPLDDFPVNRDLSPEHRERIRQHLKDLGYFE
jgi:uncharacterized membrane protein